MKGRKKKIIIWAAVLIVLALAAGLWLWPKESKAYAQTFVTTGNISTTYSFTGNIIAPRVQKAAASAPGKVKEIYVQVNQMVEEGDRLLKLSTGEIIKADIDGEVVSLNVEKDDTVGAGSALFTVIDTGRMEAEIKIDEYDVGAVQVDREVTVTVNALDITTQGRIKSFDKLASSMGTMASYKARVEFEVPENALEGMQVEVRMENESAKNALLLKVDALQFDENNQVFVLTKNSAGEYVQTYVTTGINDGTTVQILSGLYNGQIVYYADSMSMMEIMMEMRGRMR